MTAPQPVDSARYTLLASAIAGRRLQVAPAAAADGSYTDGAVVWLAGGDDPALTVVAQAALVGAGSLEPAVMRKLLRRAPLAAHYLLLELRRASSVLAQRLPARLAAHSALRGLPCSDGPLHSLELARAQPRPAATVDELGELRPARVLSTQKRRRRTAVASDADGTEETRALRQADPDRQEASRLLDTFAAPVDRASDWLSELLRSIFDMQLGGDAGEGGSTGAASGHSERTGTPFESGRRGMRRADDDRTVALARGAGQHVYPEWDETRGRYRPAWTRVAEVDPAPRAQAQTDLGSSWHEARRWARPLATLCLDHERVGPHTFGDEVLIDPLVEHEVERRTGHSPGARLYRASLRTRRDLGVLVLLDMSSSTAERDGSGQSIFERELRFGLSLTRALRLAGDRAACFGFHSWGRQIVRLQRIVDFDDPLGRGAFQRAAGLEPAGYSRLGAAVRHGAHVLQQRSGMPYQLLVFVSDGFAYDQGYERRYGASDTRRALSEARQHGVACVCVSLGSDVGDEELGAVFGSAHSFRAHDGLRSEASLARCFSRAVHAAGRRRRPGG